MNKAFLLICFFVFFSCNLIQAQESGFLGKKNMIDMNTVFTFPVLHLYEDYEDDHYKNINGELVKSKQKPIFGYEISAYRMVNKKISVGLEFGQQKFEIAYPEWFFTSKNDSIVSYSGHLEDLKFSYSYFLPKVEFCSKDGIFGMGIKHQAGLGFGITRFIEKDYLFSFLNQSQNETDLNYFKKFFYDYSNPMKQQNLIFLYTFMLRKPLSKSLMFNCGFRYTLSMRLNNSGTNSDSYFIKADDIDYFLKIHRRFNLVQFKFGLSYVF